MFLVYRVYRDGTNTPIGTVQTQNHAHKLLARDVAMEARRSKKQESGSDQ